MEDRPLFGLEADRSIETIYLKRRPSVIYHISKGTDRDSLLTTTDERHRSQKTYVKETEAKKKHQTPYCNPRATLTIVGASVQYESSNLE